MAHAPVSSDRADQFGHRAESRRLRADRPSRFGQIRARRPGILDAPVLALPKVAGLELIAADRAADLDLRKRELLEHLVLLVEGFRPEQHARVEIGPEPVAVAHPVAGLQGENLAAVPSDA